MSLQTLDLNECRILTDQGLNEIVSLTGGDLTELHLAGTDVTTEGLARHAVKLANIQVRVARSIIIIANNQMISCRFLALGGEYFDFIHHC